MLRWLQSVWVVQLLVAATPLILWLRVLSHDDHPVLKLVPQEHEKDSKLSSSLPHRCVCCAKVLCATLHSVVGVQTVTHLSPLSSACSCTSTSCQSSSHCVSWLSESSTSVLSTFASSEHSLSPRSVTCCVSSRHRGQLSVAVETVANSSRSDLVFTKALLSCVPWSSRDCSGVSTGSHIFDSAWRLSSQRRTSTAQQYQPTCTPRRSSSHQSNICNTFYSVLATEAKSFNSLDKLRAITPDALLTETFAPKPEPACNSLSLSATAARS